MEFVREPPRLAPHRPHYRLVAQLAQGGMGEVFVGRELGPKAQPGAELVAIKTLLPEAARDPMMLTRFLDEARLSARLDHPNVAKMRDFDQAEGRPFAVYELLEGADLDEVLFQLRRSGRTMSIEVAVALIIEACQGLQHAHTLKKDGVPLEVVHRDLSPSKLFLTATGELIVLDFGAAWNRDRVTMTATGRVIGKFDYMSPEQATGDKVTSRSDLFFIALCLYELLTLERAYQHAKMEQERTSLIVQAAVPRVELKRKDAPNLLVLALRRATELLPRHRFASVGDFAAALQPVASTAPGPERRALLAEFFVDCFGPDYVLKRRAGLEKLRMLPSPSVGDAFSWVAPPLRARDATLEPTLRPDARTEQAAALTPPASDGDEPHTLESRRWRGKKEPTPVLAQPLAVEAPTRGASTARPMLIIGMILVALVLLGLGAGRLLAAFVPH